MGRGVALALCLIIAVPAQALQLDLPQTARQTATRDSALEQVAVPTAPFADATLPTMTVEGPVRRSAYRIAAPGLTPLQILGPLRDQLVAGGYEILLDCDQATCGGFDFRFAIDVLPAPNMYVNIRAFHFLSARNASGTAVTLLASAAQSAGYLQVIEVGRAIETVATPDTEEDAPDTATPVAAVTDAGDFTTRLLETGSAVLQSLEFAVGTTTLSNAPSPELEAIAALLRERPGLLIAVVGHTDTIGGLETNINVSRARAQAVRTRLIDEYDVPSARVQAEGMGYLAPRASNLSEAGREANRRVEVIVVRDDG